MLDDQRSQMTVKVKQTGCLCSNVFEDIVDKAVQIVESLVEKAGLKEKCVRRSKKPMTVKVKHTGCLCSNTFEDIVDEAVQNSSSTMPKKAERSMQKSLSICILNSVSVPKLPITDHLHNQGKPAFLKWKEPKNLHMEHDNFCAKIK